MTQDKKPREGFDIRDELKDVLSDKFLNQALNHAEAKYTNRLQIQPFILGCAYGAGFYKKEIEAYQSLLDKVGELEGKLKDYESALGFYADSENWARYSGKRAREVLAKHRGGDEANN